MVAVRRHPLQPPPCPPLPPALAVTSAPALLAALLGAADVTAPAGPAPAAAAAVDFTRDIAPLLAARCYQCHGPDSSSRKAGLRLDKRDAAIASPRDPGSRPAIVPGDPDASELIARVTSGDTDLRMPPTDGHAALSRAEVDALRAWIAAGAPYAKHWSWQPLPAVDSDRAQAVASGTGWSALRDAHVAPSVDAAAWLRRVHFDLTGLPPSVEECRAFEAEIAGVRMPRDAAAARSRVVDALLASPRYGERWGRHWMDVMRFAETHGHEFDYQIDEAWRWRDWVIRAFNADVPYADFVREQIAGDLLASPRRNPDDGTNESVAATGWWWMSQGTHAPVDVRLDQAERVDNQIDVASKAFLGTTASCARCHDHKFDDVSQRDYYAMFGVVKSSRRAYAYQDPHGAIAAAVEALRRGERTMPVAAPATAVASAAPAAATWTFDRGSFEGWTASGWAFGDGPVTAGDPVAADGRATVIATGGWAHSGRIAERLQGTLRSPTFTVPANAVSVRCAGTKASVRLIVDGYYLDERNALLFEHFIQPIDHPGEWRTHVWNTARYAGEQAYLEVIDDGDGFVAVDWVVPSAVTGVDMLPAPFEGLGAAGSGGAAPCEIPAPVRVLAMEDGTGIDSPLYVRGVSGNLGEMVPRGMIGALRAGVATRGDGAAPVDTSGSGRLQLAEEIVAPGNPLTWRVMANRVWHHLTGRGIVASADDFGVLGQAPADQELLDELAMRLRAHGSVKQLIREIVLSPRYADGARPVRRLDGEALRDAIVQVAGGLDLTMGGPSVPVHLTDAMQGRGRPGASGPVDGASRRSVYLEVRRNFLAPFMQVFDQPVPTTTVGARSVSNVPAQGLTLMNDAFVRGQAERWGGALAADARSQTERVREAYLKAYGREPTVDEAARAEAFLGANPAAAEWSDFAHAIFLSTEFRYLR